MTSNEKLLAILTAIADHHGSAYLSTIAEAAGVPVSTTHRILTHLTAAKWVTRDEERRYELGPAFVYLATRRAA